MGASRGRIVVQLMTENLAMAAIGGAIGVSLGAAGLRAMASRAPNEIPRWITFALDWRFAMFCVAITGAAALLFGLAPILEACRSDIGGAPWRTVGRLLRDGGGAGARAVRESGRAADCHFGGIFRRHRDAAPRRQAFRRTGLESEGAAGGHGERDVCEILLGRRKSR